jgi:hypothetical protein
MMSRETYFNGRESASGSYYIDDARRAFLWNMLLMSFCFQDEIFTFHDATNQTLVFERSR